MTTEQKGVDAWLPIDSAPQDGRPVWVRGWDWGKPNTSRHFGWVHWDGMNWCWAGSDPHSGHATHLTDWRQP